MEINEKINRTQEIPTTEKVKNETEDTWTLEKANALVDELLKDIPVGHKKGSVIWPVRKPYLSAKENFDSQTTEQIEKKS